MLCIAGDWHVSRALYDSCRTLKTTFPFSPVFLGLILPIFFFYWCEYASSVGGFGSKKFQGIALAGTAWFEGNTEQSSCRRSLAGTEWAKFLLKDQDTAQQSPTSYVVPSLFRQPATEIAAAAHAVEIKPNIPCVWPMPKGQAVSILCFITVAVMPLSSWGLRRSTAYAWYVGTSAADRGSGFASAQAQLQAWLGG